MAWRRRIRRLGILSSWIAVKITESRYRKRACSNRERAGWRVLFPRSRGAGTIMDSPESFASGDRAAPFVPCFRVTAEPSESVVATDEIRRVRAGSCPGNDAARRDATWPNRYPARFRGTPFVKRWRIRAIGERSSIGPVFSDSLLANTAPRQD